MKITVFALALLAFPLGCHKAITPPRLTGIAHLRSIAESRGFNWDIDRELDGGVFVYVSYWQQGSDVLLSWSMSNREKSAPFAVGTEDADMLAEKLSLAIESGEPAVESHYPPPIHLTRNQFVRKLHVWRNVAISQLRITGNEVELADFYDFNKKSGR